MMIYDLTKSVRNGKVIFERLPPPPKKKQKKNAYSILVRVVLSHSCGWLNSGTENETLPPPPYRGLGQNAILTITPPSDQLPIFG